MTNLIDKVFRVIIKGFYITVFFVCILTAYSAPFPDVIAVLGEWGSLHIVTGDGKVKLKYFCFHNNY